MPSHLVRRDVPHAEPGAEVVVILGRIHPWATTRADRPAKEAHQASHCAQAHTPTLHGEVKHGLGVDRCPAVQHLLLAGTLKEQVSKGLSRVAPWYTCAIHGKPTFCSSSSNS